MCVCVCVCVQTIKSNESLLCELSIRNVENRNGYYKAIHSTYNHTEQMHAGKGKLTLEKSI